MNKKCPDCNLINFPHDERCARCQMNLISVESGAASATVSPKILRRVLVCILSIIFVIAGFYLSLIFSAKNLNYDERQTVERSISKLDEKEFGGEVFLLNHLAAFRSNDNWLNASVVKENAYAATNFPFEIMTLYPDFFNFATDDIERAAILLHEAQHLKGADEKKAYEFVWKNRQKLGWTRQNYGRSVIWLNVRKQTKEYAPNLFVCDGNEFSDCTEN